MQRISDVLRGLVSWWTRAGRRAGVIAAAVLLLAVLFLVLWPVPQWQAAGSGLAGESLIRLEDDLRGTWASIAAGVLLLAGVVLTWRRVEAAEHSVEIAREGQITERFTRAIELLGSEKLQVRLGAIYALERIARDSERDHWPIMEVLTAYVRENAPWRGDAPPRDAAPEGQAEQSRPERRTPPADIQAILTVIGRRGRWYGNGEEQPINLRQTDLRSVDLTGVHLESADLVGAALDDTRLLDAHLEDASLGGISLKKARLEYANLKRAWLAGADLFLASVDRAVLDEAVLWNTNLHKANLQHGSMERTQTLDTNLEGAILFNTSIRGADLSRAIGLTQEQVDLAILDENTQLPEGLRHPGTEE